MPAKTIKSQQARGARLKSLYVVGFGVIAMFLMAACSEEQVPSPDNDASLADDVAEVCDHVLGQYGYAYAVIETACTEEVDNDRSSEEVVAEVCDLVEEEYPYAHRGLVRDGICP
ncbi:hypothetical protein M0534_00875 [Methylonatrum kenyense]|uniref:hypothetical protein n=1 Tax=Methylonatrum kenyense TaxID=455253 RepID=UPI0020BE7800|nr:hypothetical protein [Methylonatrum kenyense]MCK8514885.1 hypothetical protein [Methylonatrum kenyense]